MKTGGKREDSYLLLDILSLIIYIPYLHHCRAGLAPPFSLFQRHTIYDIRNTKKFRRFLGHSLSFHRSTVLPSNHEIRDTSHEIRDTNSAKRAGIQKAK